MERVTIDVQLREKVGKETAKKVRQAGDVPAVVYGKDINIAVQISPASMKILKSVHFSESAVIDMNVLGAKKKSNFPVLIKDIQFNPLSEAIIHLDFVKISLDEKARVHVPIVFKGEPKAVKEGAMLEQILREVEIEALPLSIPEHIEIDVSALEVGDSIHVSDIKIESLDVKIMTHLDETIATLVGKKEEEEEEAVAQEGAEGAEPEVIKEKKEEQASEEK